MIKCPTSRYLEREETFISKENARGSQRHFVYSIVQYSIVQYSIVQYSTVQYNIVQHTMLYYIIAWYGTASRSIAQHSIAFVLALVLAIGLCNSIRISTSIAQHTTHSIAIYHISQYSIDSYCTMVQYSNGAVWHGMVQCNIICCIMLQHIVLYDATLCYVNCVIAYHVIGLQHSPLHYIIASHIISQHRELH